MDWIKVKTNHILWEYNDLSDKEFRAWINIMALTSRLSHVPTDKQLLGVAHHKTIKSLEKKLINHSRDLQDILKKVLRDAQDIADKKAKTKERVRKHRSINLVKNNEINKLEKIDNKECNALPNSYVTRQRREEKISINTINNINTNKKDDDDTLLMSSSSFLEIFKNEEFLINPVEFCQSNLNFCFNIAKIKSNSVSGLKDPDSYVSCMINGLQGGYKDHEISSLIKQARNLADNEVLKEIDTRTNEDFEKDREVKNLARSEQYKRRRDAFNKLTERDRLRILRKARESVSRDCPSATNISINSGLVKQMAYVLANEEIC